MLKETFTRPHTQDPLRDPDGVLRGPSGDVLDGGAVVLLEVVVDVLLLVEDSVVGLEAVLLDELRLDGGGDVEEGVAHAEEHARLHIAAAAARRRRRHVAAVSLLMGLGEELEEVRPLESAANT